MPRAESLGAVERFDPLSETVAGSLTRDRFSRKGNAGASLFVNPKQFLPRLKALAPLAGRHFPTPVLETTKLLATADGRGVLRAMNLDAGAELEVPLLKVIRPGTVQLPTASVIKAIADAKIASVEVEELPTETRPPGARFRTGAGLLRLLRRGAVTLSPLSYNCTYNTHALHDSRNG